MDNDKKNNEQQPMQPESSQPFSDGLEEGAVKDPVTKMRDSLMGAIKDFNRREGVKRVAVRARRWGRKS